MQVLYGKALPGLAKGASGCRSAISERPAGDEGIDTAENKPLLDQSLSELVAASKELYQATAEVRALARG